MSTTIVTATQCSGMLLVFEKMFESRLFFVDKLIGMGARIVSTPSRRFGPVRPSGALSTPTFAPHMMLLAAMRRRNSTIRAPD
jgi:UDP-N-acetylglucosamine 1-carboxyvinyltransferase